MADNRCPQCGAPIDPGANECMFCGERLAVSQIAQQLQKNQPQQFQQYQQPQQFQQFQQPQQPIYGQPQVIIQTQPIYSGINPAWPVKNKIVAALLAIFLGAFGIHKFYLGKIGMGILYLLFFWTGITAFIGFIEGIIYLCTSDLNFQLKHHVRVI